MVASPPVVRNLLTLAFEPENYSNSIVKITSGIFDKLYISDRINLNENLILFKQKNFRFI